MYANFLQKKTLFLVPGLVKGGGRRKQIVIGLILNLEDLFYPSEDLVEEVEIFPKNTWRYPR